jgi:hypothetical protein
MMLILKKEKTHSFAIWGQHRKTFFATENKLECFTLKNIFCFV